MSNNAQLRKLKCRDNHLGSLDVSNNAQLKFLSCGSNALSNLNVSGCTQLTELHCRSNDLSSLDVSNNTQLTRLDCENNALSNLNVSGCTQLMWLRCSNNALSSLNVSNNTSLDTLYCSANALSSLNLSNNGQLTELYCSGNALSSLNLSNNGQLTELYCGGNALSSLNLSNNGQLTDLYCGSNDLSDLDVSNNTQLTYLNCYGNDLSSLDVSNNTQLTRLDCGWNALTSLNVANGNNNNMLKMLAQNNPNLLCIQHDAGFDPKSEPCYSHSGFTYGWCKDATASWSEDCDAVVNIPDANFKSYLVGRGDINTNGDGEIQVYEAAAFTGIIFCIYKDIQDLTGIEAFTQVSELNCAGNLLENMDISQNGNLTELTCYGNRLSSLDVTNNTALTELNCWRNELISLDLSQNTNLVKLNCNENEITNLDITNNTALTSLKCKDNKLTSLELANGYNDIITTMWAENNPDLLCIQHDAGFDPTTKVCGIVTGWCKDATASWNEDCDAVVYIPDVNFKAYLVGRSDINTNGDGEIQVYEAEAFTDTIDCGNKYIGDLRGIEAFTGITKLECYHNYLSSLDVSHNTKLIYLNCADNQLSSLDVSQNKDLKHLDFSQNNYNIGNVDLSQNEDLITLYCSSSSLSTLDVSQNTHLKTLKCGYNNLNSLDVSQNVYLDELHCSWNDLTHLYLHENTRLEVLKCDNNQIEELNLVNHSYLRELACHNNQLTSLNVANGNNSNMTQMHAQDNTTLTCIDHDEGFDPDTKPCATSDGWCKDATANWNGTDYSCTPPPAGSPYVTVDVVSGNQIKLGMGAEGLHAEVWVEISPGNYHFLTLEYSYISIAYMAETNTIKVYGDITYFSCGDNGANVTGVDISNNLGLKTFYCKNDSISNLDISDNTNLRLLDCTNTQLSSLDISHNGSLSDLYCNDNTLNSLDLSNNGSLTILHCNNNQLQTLDVSHTTMKMLECKNNQLTVLNVATGGNSEMTKMWAQDNPDLFCIKHDLGFDPDSKTCTATDGWCKDATANWNGTGYSCTPPAGAKTMTVKAAQGSTINVGFFGEIVKKPVWVEITPGVYDIFPISNLGWVNKSYTIPATPPVWGGSEGFAPPAPTDVDVTIYGDVLGFDCNDNGSAISEVNTSNNKDLKILKCKGNGLSALDVSANSDLTDLDCSNNSLSDLDVDYNPDLKHLNCSENNLSQLVLGANYDLLTVDCRDNRLSGHMSFIKCPLLQELRCGRNTYLTGINVSNNPDLTYLYCGLSNISALDVTNNQDLEELLCNGNSIGSLDLSQNEALTRLDCRDNALNSLDVSQNVNLTKLWCPDNQITSLDVSANEVLTDLNCKDNALTSLNVANGNNSNMTRMHAGGNSALTCIQHDASFDPTTEPCTIYNGWCKDATASWNTDCGSVLGIELLSFKAKAVDNEYIKLDWTTATETDNDYFEVERSIDGVAWEVVAKIDGAGNSNSVLKYKAWDEEPYTGVSYYRLKQTDMDGAYSYSDAVAVSIGASKALKVYPNPAREILRIEIGKDIAAGEQIRILNVAGKLVATKPAKSHVIKIDVSDFEAGVYFVKVGGEVVKVVVSD